MPNTQLNKKFILFVLLVLSLFALAAEASYSISYSQKSPGAQASALSFKDNAFWTSVKGKQSGTTAIVRFDPYSYSIETFLTLPVRLIKGLHFLSEKRLLVLALESSASANYVILELDVETKNIVKSQALPKSWGAVTAFAVEDAEHFWVATANPNQLKRFLPKTLEVLSTIEIKEGSAHGLTINQNDLWVSVNRFNEPALIQKRQLENGEIGEQFLFHEAAGSISGLFVKENLWVISFGINRLIELELNVSEKKSFRPTWKKAWSSVAERLQHSPFNSFGLKESEKSPSVKRKSFSALSSSPLPSKHDWRNYQGHNWLTSVKDQGQCGSCVAFSSAAIEAQYRISHKLPQLDLNLSEQNAFSCSKGKCNMGTGFTEVLESAIKQGIPDELCLPYKSGNLGLDQECRPCSQQEKRSITLDHYEEVSDYGFGTVEDLKRALLQGPLLTRMYVFDDFFYYRAGIYKHESGEYRGRHVVAIVGYDDETQALIVKNSWGPYWGENGYFQIAYDDISSVGATTYQAIINTAIVPFSLFLNQNVITSAEEKLSLEVVKTKENANFDLDLLSSRSSISERTTLDVSELADGIYELILSDPLSGQIRTEQLMIQRETPKTKLILNALQKKVNKTTFSLSCSEDSPIPKVLIELSDGEKTLIEEKSWPCPETKFTIFHSNLKHPITAKAKILIGPHQITSNRFRLNNMRIQNLALLVLMMFQLASCGARTERPSGVYYSELILPLEKSALIEEELQQYAEKLSISIENFRIGELSVESLIAAIPGLPDTVKGVCVVQGKRRSIALTIGRDLNFDLSIVLHELGHCAMNLPHKELRFESPYHLVKGHLIPKHVMYPHFIVSNKIILACEDVFIKNLKTGEEISRKELKSCLKNTDSDVVSNYPDEEDK